MSNKPKGIKLKNMMYWNNSNYGNDIELKLTHAEMMSHQGQCDSDVKFGMTIPYIKKQLDALDKDQIKKELFNYGAWDDDDLSDHQDNLMRWLWVSAGNVVDNRFDEINQ